MTKRERKKIWDRRIERLKEKKRKNTERKGEKETI